MKLKREPMAAKIALLAFFIISVALAASSALAAPVPITVRDDMNREIVLPRPAVRIVAIGNAHAENLVALKAVRQLAGVDVLADPKWIPKFVPRLSRKPDIKQIKNSKPDLVLFEKDRVAENRELLGKLSKSGIPYAIFSVPRLASFETYIYKLGQLAGREKEAARTIKDFEKAILKSDVRPVSVKKPKVLIVAGADFSVSAPGSWAAGIVRAAGGSLYLDRGGVPVNGFPWYVLFGPKRLKSSGEGIDVIITLTGTNRMFPALSREEIMRNPDFKNVPAVKNGRVWEMKAADMTLPSMLRLDSSLKRCWQLIYAKGKPLDNEKNEDNKKETIKDLIKKKKK